MKFQLSQTSDTYDKIQAIKALRIIGGYTLKEAKDIVDAANNGRITTFSTVARDEISNETSLSIQLSYIRGAGYTVQPAADVLIDKLSILITEALAAKEYSLAKNLISVLESHDNQF